MKLKVYTDPGNFQTLKICVASKLAGVDVQWIEVKHTECVVPYLSHPKLPAVETSDGKFLFSANVAAKYVYLKAGKELDEDAENELLEWENASLLPYVSSYLVSLIGQGRKDKTVADVMVRTLQQLDAKLNKTSFLLGNSLSLCDVCVYSTLYPMTLLKNCDLLEKFPHIKKWLALVSNNPGVQQAVNDVTKGKEGQEVFKQSLLTQSFPVAATTTKPSNNNNPSTKGKDAPSASQPDQIVFEKVEEGEMKAAKDAWTSDVSQCPKPNERVHPIHPKEGERNIMVTSALPYVNNVPHLGNIIGCVLSADVFSRFCRMRNYNVIYICGTDEYGTATETKALQEGVTPREICDKYNKLHAQIYEWFNIDFDHFGRTSQPKQTEIAQDMFKKLYDKGYVLKDTVEQLHCNQCSKFLADRFVEGTCPFCGFEDARGDQCDGCGKLINAVELKNPSCKMCKSSPVIKSTNHLFLDLPKAEPKLRAHLDKVYESGTWTNNARVITNSWLRDGLKPRCISRDLKWGVSIPLEGYTEKVFYVWFDAPIGYISITAHYTEEWEKWWKNPEKVEMYNFLGKDNVPFHSVIFPSCLLGADDGYTVVQHMIATEYLNYEDTKFSKSRGTGIFGDHAANTGIPADVFRFYLLYVRPESQDTSFSWDDFLLKNNSELLNNLGNFINRSLSFLSTNFGGVIQPMEDLTEEDLTLIALITRELKTYVTNLEACRLRDGVRNILTISKLGNQYMQSNKPWVLAKGSDADKKRAGLVVSLNCNVSCLLSVLLQPYMPCSSATIQQQLAAPQHVNVITDSVFVPCLQPGHRIGNPSPLFQKIETKTIQDLKAKFAGKPQDKPATKKAGRPSANVSGGASVTANPEEAARLTKAVSDQGNKVRELKAQKAEKSVIDAEVKALLQLKQDLAAVSGSGSAGAGGGGSSVAANPEEAARLTQAVSDQGNKVRELKAQKAEKSVIDAEVKALLQLKQDLAAVSGSAGAGGGGGGDDGAGAGKKNNKSKGKGGGGGGGGGNKSAGAAKDTNTTTTTTPAGAGVVDAAEVDRLTQAVSDQGNKVRDLKIKKAEKATIDGEVAALLSLKRDLAKAQGLDPDATTASSSGGKKKGKKK